MKFLVPTDFSDYAADALVYAIELSKVFGGSVTLLNAYPSTSISPYVYDELIKSINEEVKIRTLNKLKNEWIRNSRGILAKDSTIKSNFIAKEGGIVESIVNTARKEKADMIVMGTKGAGPIKRFLFGTTASKVINEAHCPVLTVPKLAKYKKINRILFATGCNSHELDSITDVIKFAKRNDALVHIVYISDDIKDDAQNRLDKLKKSVQKKSPYGKLHFELIRSSDITDALNVYIQVKKINLLSLATKRRTIFNKLFDKNLAKELSYHLRIPLLAYHR